MFVFVGEILQLDWPPIRISSNGKVVATSASTYLGINPDSFVALLANVGEHRLVTLDAVWMFIAQNVSLAGQAVVAIPTAKVRRVPVLGHCFRVFTTKN